MDTGVLLRQEDYAFIWSDACIPRTTWTGARDKDKKAKSCYQKNSEKGNIRFLGLKGTSSRDMLNLPPIEKILCDLGSSADPFLVIAVICCDRIKNLVFLPEDMGLLPRPGDFAVKLKGGSAVGVGGDF